MTIVLFLFYLFFGRIVPWSVPVTLALYMGRKPRLLHTLIVMIVVGLIEDSSLIHPLGVTSLVLVTLASLIWLFESFYRSKLLWWWFGFGLIGEILVRSISTKPITWIDISSQLLVLLFIFWINQRFRDSEGIYVGR